LPLSPVWVGVFGGFGCGSAGPPPSESIGFFQFEPLTRVWNPSGLKVRPLALKLCPSGLKLRGEPIDDDDIEEEIGAPCDIDMPIPPPPPIMRASAVDAKAASASSAAPIVSDFLIVLTPLMAGFIGSMAVRSSVKTELNPVQRWYGRYVTVVTRGMTDTQPDTVRRNNGRARQRGHGARGGGFAGTARASAWRPLGCAGAMATTS
jgi:hypothetical protein